MIRKFYKKNKLYIYICLIVIIFIALIIILLCNRKPSLYKYMKVNNIKKVDVTKVSDYSFLDKYNINNNVYIYNKDINISNYTGNIYYVRDKKNYNIYRIKIDTSNNNKDVPILVQIKETMNDIEKELLNVFKNIKFEEELLEGKDDNKIKISIEENIFKYNKNYVKIYKDKDIEYHINYYMNEKFFVCELIKLI